MAYLNAQVGESVWKRHADQVMSKSREAHMVALSSIDALEVYTNYQPLQ